MTPLPCLSRREALRRILVASALAASMDISVYAAEDIRRIGEDPDLLKKEIPWPRILTETERRTVAALADTIIPADEFGPAATAVCIVDFIDEWVSAPYEQQQKDRDLIRPGLAWLESKGFSAATPEQREVRLQDVITTGTDANRAYLKFFRLMRDRIAGGYYSTPEGWKAIGYVGNVPVPEFPGPTPEVLQRLGLA